MNKVTGPGVYDLSLADYHGDCAPGSDPESLPAIYGPAVIFDRIVWR